MSKPNLPAGFEAYVEPNFMGHIGPLYWRVEGKRVELGALIQPHQCNPTGVAHGGFLMSLVDVTMGINSARAVGHDGVITTVQLTSNMMSTARLGEFVIGAATIETSTRTLTFAAGRLQVGDRTILTASAVFRNPPGFDPKQAR